MAYDKNEPEVLDHDYDGIKEYDNPLPSWWLATFFITVIFGFLYWLDSEFANRPTQSEEVQAEVAEIKSRSKGGSEPNDADFKLLAADANNLEKGKVVFVGKCAVCHGQEGQGLIGPNLTDDHWIHGTGQLVEIAKVIRQGVLEKGMPNWDTQLSPEDIGSLTVFVASLIGTQPPNPKPPQGNKVAR